MMNMPFWLMFWMRPLNSFWSRRSAPSRLTWNRRARSTKRLVIAPPGFVLLSVHSEAVVPEKSRNRCTLSRRPGRVFVQAAPSVLFHEAQVGERCAHGLVLRIHELARAAAVRVGVHHVLGI